MAFSGFFKCCSLRIFAFSIGILFLIVQTTFLILTFVPLTNIEKHVNDVTHLTEWFPDLFNSSTALSNDFIRKSGDFMAIPITISVVLIISDTLLIWATATKTRLLMWPWLILHMAEALFFLGSMIFLMIYAGHPWLKVVIFLVGCPLVILLAFFWGVINCFHNYLRDLGLKTAMAQVYKNGYHKKRLPTRNGPSTMYTPEPHHWDHPVPVWAMRPPPSAWDPEYLQKLDPRYQLDPRRTPLESRPFRTTSSHLSSSISNRKPAQVLPDGTIVVPIGSESENEEIGSEDSNKFGSVRTLSDKYQKPIDALTDDGIISHVISSSGAAAKSPISEDRCSSIVSLSDKYRQQEEVEIFTEHYQKPPPEPIRPPKAKSSSTKGSSAISATSSQSTESSRT